MQTVPVSSVILLYLTEQNLCCSLAVQSSPVWGQQAGEEQKVTVGTKGQRVGTQEEELWSSPFGSVTSEVATPQIFLYGAALPVSKTWGLQNAWDWTMLILIMFLRP